MKNIEELLKPISTEKPCGEDMSNSPAYDELVTILKGKPEVEIGNVKKAAEPPDWRQLEDKSAEFLRQSKHLRPGMMLCCSLIKNEGLPGFREGLKCVSGLVNNFWGNLYPALDPEDNNDPTMRLNILSGLTSERGSVDGWLKIVDYLYAAPLFKAKGGASVSFEQLDAAKLKASGSSAAPADAPDLAPIEVSLRANAEQVKSSQQILKDCQEALGSLDSYLTNTLTAGNTISFEVLNRELKKMVGYLEAYLGDGAAPAGVEQAEGGPAPVDTAPGAGPAGIQVTGSIRSPQDVVRQLESICSYYRQVEPSSPVLYLLMRAQKVAKMDFLAAMKELNLATNDALRPVMGSIVDEVEAAAAAAEQPATE